MTDQHFLGVDFLHGCASSRSFKMPVTGRVVNRKYKNIVDSLPPPRHASRATLEDA